MSYRIMDSGLCVEKGIEALIAAQDRAEDYAREASIDTVTIEDEETGKVVTTGRVTMVVEWKDA